MKKFKICQKCGKIWGSREEFLALDDLIPLGFQAHFLDGSKSVLLFEHEAANCGTTLAVAVTEMIDLFPEYNQMPVAVNTSECTGLCLTDNRLEPCGNSNCRNALVRKFVAELNERKRHQQKSQSERQAS